MRETEGSESNNDQQAPPGTNRIKEIKNHCRFWSDNYFPLSIFSIPGRLLGQNFAFLTDLYRHKSRALNTLTVFGSGMLLDKIPSASEIKVLRQQKTTTSPHHDEFPPTKLRQAASTESFVEENTTLPFLLAPLPTDTVLFDYTPSPISSRRCSSLSTPRSLLKIHRSTSDYGPGDISGPSENRN